MFNFKFFYNFLFLSKNILFVLGSIFILSCNNNSTNPFVLPLGLTINPYNLSPLSAVYVRESINQEQYILIQQDTAQNLKYMVCFQNLKILLKFMIVIKL